MNTNPNRQRQPGRPTKRRGAITLEAVMVFPLLLMIFFGSFEFAWMFYVRHTLSNAAREGARVAIIEDATGGDVTSAVGSAISNGGMSSIDYTCVLKNGSSTISSPSSVAAGDPVTVTVKAPWSQFSVLNTPIASFWTSDIEVKATMRREG